MKKLFFAIAFAAVLSGCHKEDSLIRNDEATAAQQQPGVVSSGFQNLSLQSGAANGKGITASEGSINVEAVNQDVLTDGLVLLFSRSAAAVSTLPFTDNSGDWNYDVTDGEILVSSYSKSAVPSVSVAYVILSSQKVKELGATGYSRSDLVNLNFRKAQSLFGLQ